MSFEIAGPWLNRRYPVTLDPNIQPWPGQQYGTFGIVGDSCPDRWGEIIMTRREAIESRLQGRPIKNLFKSDFLLGVDDRQRMGGLRFKLESDGPFLSDNTELGAPPWARLRELESAAWSIQAADADENPALGQWLNLLIAPGSSLGGARPKAGVCDEDGCLWIAKFPSQTDTADTQAWEMVTHELATNAGINIGEARLEKFGNQHKTFMVKRFDREVVDGELQRIHFASAMTMLGHTDGNADHGAGVSYLDIVEFLMKNSTAPECDIRELWRRIVFSICVANTDDHLRNHGFLLGSDGWRLSPAYDLNPVPTGTGLSLNISDEDNSLDLNLAMEVAEFFRLSNKEAKTILDEVVAAVSNWEATATKYGLSRFEQQRMEPAFRRAKIQ